MNATGAGTAHLDVGGVFDATTELYKKCFGTVWIVAVVLLLPAAIIVAILGDDGFLGLIGSLVNLAATAWLAGTVVKIVEDAEADGQVDMGPGQLLGLVWPRLLPLMLLQILFAIAVFIGLILLIVPGVIIALMWVVALPAMVVEDRGVAESFSRSSELTRGNRMRILAVGLLVLLIYIGITILGLLLAAISPVLGVLALVVAGVLLYPYVSIISAVLFFRLRDLIQGVVIEETRIVEERLDPPNS